MTLLDELNEELLNVEATLLDPDDSQKLRELVDKGWRECYKEWFGQDFVNALAPHHIEAVEWHWDARLKFVKGEKPDYLAYFPIWSRGHLKSSIAERLVIVDAMLSTAYKKAGYALYLSANKEKVQEHIANIETLMSSAGVRKWNPKLATPQRTEITNQQRKWTASFLKTGVDYSIQGGTLESGLAGSRVDETRPTFIIPDDVDGREDSPIIAENRLRQFTTGVLPMRQDNTLVFFAQNLISRYSMMYRIYKGHSRVLTNRKPSEPIPAVRNLITEQRVVDGIIKDIYVSGEPTWQVWDVRRIQDEIDTEGLESFKKECLHLVDEDKSGQILYNYDDDVHVISESEFASVYGKDAWKYWRKKCGNDWARTKTDKHANVATWLTVSDASTRLPNMTFMMHPMSFAPNSAPEDVAERLLSCLSPFAYDEITWSQLRKDIVRKINADVHTNTVAERISYEHGELSRIIPKYSAPLLQEYNVSAGEMSHEQDTVRKIYSSVYGLFLKPVNPRKHGGTETINRLMRVDREMSHPFRPDQLGYTQWFMVVPDNKEAEYREVDGLKIYPPKPYPIALQTKDMDDDDLARFQLTNCRYRPPILTATGEEIDVPEKMYDDFHNLLQMMTVGGQLTGTSLTTEQKIRMTMPSTVLGALATATTAEAKLSSALVYEFERDLAEQKLGLHKDDEDEDEFH